MTMNYVSNPMPIWWNAAETGPAPDCAVCGAMMVRIPHPRPDEISGELFVLHFYRPAGWGCISCKNYIADTEARNA